MKKVVIVSGLIVACILLIVGIIYLPHKPEVPKPNITPDNLYSDELRSLINKQVPHDKLIRITYSNSGDSLGNVDVIELDITNLVIRTKYTDSISNPVTIKEYSITEDNIKDIEEYVNKYNLIAWAGLPIDTDLIALDAPEKSIKLTYDNRSINNEIEYYTISYNSKIPREGYPILNDLIIKLSALLNDNNLINEYQEKETK